MSDFIIRDPNTNNAAKVVEDHLLTTANTQTRGEHISEDEALYFSWSAVAFDPANAGTILLVQNDDSEKVLHITDISYSSDLASEFDIHLTDGAILTPAGTAVVGVCLNDAASKVAEAIAKANETNNVQGRIIRAERLTADTPGGRDYGGSIILRKGQSIAVDITTSPTAVANCNIEGYYD